jgi:aspartyl-tRNA(Asn)/glutamyl-tRNA(Gln) amidotransferase subunit B
LHEHRRAVPKGKFRNAPHEGLQMSAQTEFTASAAPKTADKSLLVRGYEVVIGFETHAQLSTLSKIFSRASTAFGAEPNTQACAVDLALPGSLPVMNKGAVERAIRFGLAVNAHVAERSVFARKNYFYPDLPKGYQISQFEIPVVQGGDVGFMLDGEPRSVRLVRAHLEEDAGKSLHEDFIGQSGIDLNRAGTPLLEIVTEPDMRSSLEAVAYARELHRLVTWIGICDGNMQEGSFRCDANVSVRKPGDPLGTRREIKNLNSFKFMQQAIDYEVRWQIEQIEDGHAIEQATVLFDPATGETRAMRTKEDAADYRYFPDPDLPPLVIAQSWIDAVREAMPELPRAKAARFESVYELSAYDANQLTQSQALARYFETVAIACERPKLAANWVLGEVSAFLNREQIDIDDVQVPIPTALGELLKKVDKGEIHNNAAKTVLQDLFQDLIDRKDQNFWELATYIERIEKSIKDRDLAQMNDSGALEAIVDEVVAANAKSVEEFRQGKDKAFNALVGQIMKASRGKANPAQVNELLRKKLG